ncbi:MAG: helix-turn-helix transcriptional regulator [Phycisphaeraceae bacterium]|nr:helix-turn-helix transcriptional regulator [Phycisphaeraceae bacterium]
MMTQTNKQSGVVPGPCAPAAMSPRQAAASPGPVDALLLPEFFKALSDPTRVRLVACMIKCGRACTVSEVADCCSVDFSVVSRHLAMLEQSGLLTAEKKGRSVHYAARHQHLSGMLRALADAIDACNPEDPSCCGGACGCGTDKT